MPKLKSHSGTKKRFRKSARGKIRYKTSGKRHLLTGMSASRSRSMRKKGTLGRTGSRMIRRLLP